jgi:hypothetical protein
MFSSGLEDEQSNLFNTVRAKPKEMLEWLDHGA